MLLLPAEQHNFCYVRIDTFMRVYLFSGRPDQLHTLLQSMTRKIKYVSFNRIRHTKSVI